MFDIEPRNVAGIISCSVCCPSGEDFIKEILRRLIFSYLKKIATIGLLRELQNILPREPLLTIYKSFVKPHLDYGIESISKE